MKKIYSTPELEYVELETADMIAELPVVTSGEAQSLSEEEKPYGNGGDGFAKFNNFQF